MTVMTIWMTLWISMTIFAKENLKKRCIFLSDMRKKHVVHYVGITNADATENDTMDEKICKRQPSKYDQCVFMFPVNGDSDEVYIEDITKLLHHLFPVEEQSMQQRHTSSGM